MLQIKNVHKQYKTGSLVQNALDGVSLSLRDNEFVAVLGPSGSGKTTLLNIIGGLDRYDSGDLVINGISTTDYTDRDWDTYRNHSIGFVFQSYNLIAHQSVLANVELALTISGISKSERRKKAISALEKVGLSDQIHKKPNQMSGGQMQRVALARALVNNPEILLADEPTGALDTQTGLQVMELLKEVAKDRLVIMVTHNPDLAEKYATRIVNLRDGKITSDSNPCTESEIKDTKKSEKPKKKAKMSFLTSLGLSFNNLLTKKGRTFMTSAAGSIGIIGIALILALSSGVNLYIDDMQRSTMTSYPITISSATIDMDTMINIRDTMMGQVIGNTEYSEPPEGIHSNSMELTVVNSMKSALVENDLTLFKKYVDNPESEIAKYIGENGVVYTYDTHFDVYIESNGNYLNTSREIKTGATSPFGSSKGGNDTASMMSSMFGTSGSGARNFTQLLPGKNGSAVSKVVTDSYDVISGRWPNAYDEAVLVLDEKNSLSTTVMYRLGLISEEQYNSILKAVEEGAEEVKEIDLKYSDAIGKEFSLVTFSDYYEKNDSGLFYNKAQILGGLNSVVEEKGLKIKLVGIIRANQDASTRIFASVAYTSALTDYIIERTNSSEAILAQEASPDTDVLSGRSFVQANDEEKAALAIGYMKALGVSDKAKMFAMIQYMSTGTSNGTPSGAIPDENVLAGMLDAYLEGSPDKAVLLTIYDTYLSGGSYEKNMTAFGKVSYDAPSSISIYCDSFEDKEAISACITNYNKTVDEESMITYTDYISLLTDTITDIIDIISYVLIAFVAVSLVVSCIMISIITQISVLERTKEIGILRSIGASKGNISQVFNAETFIIGITSGAFGVLVSGLLIIPINAVIHSLAGSTDINAVLPVKDALILVAVSILITVFSGLIPALRAAKKDPVIALRTE